MDDFLFVPRARSFDLRVTDCRGTLGTSAGSLIEVTEPDDCTEDTTVGTTIETVVAAFPKGDD